MELGLILAVAVLIEGLVEYDWNTMPKTRTNTEQK